MISPGSRYVALGSSFAAGPGIAPVLDKAAGRSGRNYPHLVAERARARPGRRHVRRRDDRAPAHRPPGRRGATDRCRRPRHRARHGDEQGGNDLEYIGAFVRGSMMNTLAKPATLLGRRVANRIRARVSYLPRTIRRTTRPPDSSAEIVTRVRDRAPAARILLVDYLDGGRPAHPPPARRTAERGTTPEHRPDGRPPGRRLCDRRRKVGRRTRRESRS